MTENLLARTAHRRLFLAVLLICFVPLCVPAQEASDTKSANSVSRAYSRDSLTYVYGPSYRNPFVISPSQPDGADIPRNTVQFTHVGSWKYGSNLVDIRFQKSGSAEPASGGGNTGAMGAHGAFRTALSLDRMTGRKIFARGAVRDLLVSMGVNLQTKNSRYSPEERSVMIGPRCEFSIPRGSLAVSFHYRKEWNHQGITGKDEEYDPHINFEANWQVLLAIRGLPISLHGILRINTPKGRDSFGGITAAEIMARPGAMFDVGGLLLRKRGVLEGGGGIEYWHNMYGKPADSKPGAKQTTPFVQLSINLNPQRR